MSHNRRIRPPEEDLIAAFAKTGSIKGASRLLDVPYSTLKGWRDSDPQLFVQTQQAMNSHRGNGKGIDPPPAENKITRSKFTNGENLESRGSRIKTLDQLLEAAEVDRNIWKVKHYTVNKWEQHSVDAGIKELFQIKAVLERHQEVIDLTRIKNEVVAAMQGASPESRVKWPKLKKSTGLAMEIAIPDLHIGKLAHHEECGKNYDGKLAVEAFRYVFNELLERGKQMNVERIIFAVGNDLLHVDNEEDSTTSGTRQDTDGRWQKSFRRAQNLMIEAIDSLLEVASVDIVVTPGNHGRTSEWMLGEVIRAWYRREGGVTVHDSTAPRKYIEHGTNLLGFTHGDGVKAADLPLIMASEAPEAWARTTYRTWSTGHLHQRKSTRFGSVIEDKGVEVRIAPSLSPADTWHTRNGYIGNLRAAEAHVYDKKAGRIATFCSTLPEDYARAS